LLGFTEINVQDHKFGKHYFNMLTELNKYGFQCGASSSSGLNWSIASSISGVEGWRRALRQGAAH